MTEDSEKPLYKTQKTVMQDVLEFFKTDSKGYISMPTGSGKTVLFSEIVKSNDLRCLVVVPTKQLVGQTIAELHERGVSDVRQAKNVLTLPKDQRDTRVIVATYSSLVRSDTEPWGKQVINPDEFDLVILDEAHHALAQGSLNALQAFDHAFQIGFTATPDYSEIRRLGEVLPTVIRVISIPEAVEAGLVAQPLSVLLSTNVDLSKVKIQKNEYNAVQLEKAINTFERNAQIAAFCAAELGDKKIIASCNSVDHALNLATEMCRQGVAAAAVYGGMPKTEFEKIIEQFKTGEITAVCNNKILTEGFDEKSIEVVINVAPTLSRVRHLQRTGRGLRRDEANPRKQTIIIECIDENHSQKPVFFADAEIYGSTGLDYASPESQTLLASMANYDTNGVQVFSTDAAIQARIAELRKSFNPTVVKQRVAKAATNRQTPLHARKQEVLQPLYKAFVASSATLDLGEHETWQSRANCLEIGDTGFFPAKGGPASAAKFICGRCIVQDECLAEALKVDEGHGIWGGLSEKERKKIQKAAKKGDEPEVIQLRIQKMRSKTYDTAYKRYHSRVGLIVSESAVV